MTKIIVTDCDDLPVELWQKVEYVRIGNMRRSISNLRFTTNRVGDHSGIMFEVHVLDETKTYMIRVSSLTPIVLVGGSFWYSIDEFTMSIREN